MTDILGRLEGGNWVNGRDVSSNGPPSVGSIDSHEAGSGASGPNLVETEVAQSDGSSALDLMAEALIMAYGNTVVVGG